MNNVMIPEQKKNIAGQSPKPMFRRMPFKDIVHKGAAGYQETSGIHIYCELRPTDELERAETDQKALSYLQILNDYVHFGVLAASAFEVTLLELQGNVLHFHKDGQLNSDTVLSAIRFAYIFTTTLYGRLKISMGDTWNGFAVCMDYGQSVIVRNGASPSSSAVSIGPSANRPAKQLLYGRTPAGCIDVPSGWASFVGRTRPSGLWLTLSPRDENWQGPGSRFDDASMRARYDLMAGGFQRTRLPLSRLNAVEAASLYNAEGFTVDRPCRIQAFAIRADLDGFSTLVARSFEKGGDAIDAIAVGFSQVLEFTEFLRRSVSGGIALPFAGDCGTLLVPPGQADNLSDLRTTLWLKVAIRWQEFSLDQVRGKWVQWQKEFPGASWSIAAACGDATNCLLASIQADDRRFLLGVGWPLTHSLEGQTIGKGGEILIHSQDFQFLPDGVKTLFSKVNGSDFWKASNLTDDKIRRAQVLAATSKKTDAGHYSSALAGIQIPRPRPHWRK